MVLKADNLTITVTECSKRIGISRALAFKACQRGEIPSIRVGRRILVPVKALEKMLEAGKRQGG